jgi:hypothetical protein
MRNIEHTERFDLMGCRRNSFEIGPALEQTARARDAGLPLRDVESIFQRSDQTARGAMLRRLGANNPLSMCAGTVAQSGRSKEALNLNYHL